jgi:AcrR family transcriptional regulator
MPRAQGQFDAVKRGAILEAAAEVFAERGLGAPLEAIAAQARVSKQTLYNHFGGRVELLRALISDRRSLVTAPLDAPDADDHPEDALAGYAEAMMRRYIAPRTSAMFKVAIAAAGEHPEAARVVLETGPRAARARLAAYLARETALGRLDVPRPDEAAEMFAGMAAGHMLLGLLLGGEAPADEADIARRARDCAQRFVRAFAPQA